MRSARACVLAAGVAGELARLPTPLPGETKQPQQLFLGLDGDVVEVSDDEHDRRPPLCTRDDCRASRPQPTTPRGSGPGSSVPSRGVGGMFVAHPRARGLPPGVLRPPPRLLPPPLLVANSHTGRPYAWGVRASRMVSAIRNRRNDAASILGPQRGQKWVLLGFLWVQSRCQPSALALEGAVVERRDGTWKTCTPVSPTVGPRRFQGLKPVTNVRIVASESEHPPRRRSTTRPLFRAMQR